MSPTMVHNDPSVAITGATSGLGRSCGRPIVWRADPADTI
jgi:hypothetical protein